MSQDEFTKLFKYVQEIDTRTRRMEENMVTKEDHNRLVNAVDAYAKQAEDYMQEMLALSHKVDRLERWINQIAAKTGVKLEY